MPIPIVLQDDGMAFRVGGKHEDRLLSCMALRSSSAAVPPSSLGIRRHGLFQSSCPSGEKSEMGSATVDGRLLCDPSKVKW